MEPEQVIAQLKQEAADAKAEAVSLKKALDTREADNKAARDRIKALEAEKAELAPPEGATILTPDDAARWVAYQELGTPETVSVRLGDYERATTEASRLKRKALVDQVARDPQDETAYRYKPTVLDRLLADSVLTITDKGEALVKHGDVEKPLDKWLSEDQADFMPALTVTTGTPAARQAGDRRTPAPGLTTEQIAAQKRASGEYGV